MYGNRNKLKCRPPATLWHGISEKYTHTQYIEEQITINNNHKLHSCNANKRIIIIIILLLQLKVVFV